ncbi:MAG: hypothetical protein J6R59_02670 [Paludibacteraceae bacterium]|nr:hypothetical protein [Paludibacteraceae bacterium]
MREQSSKGFEINVDFDTIDVNLIVIERAFKKTISNIVWDENNSHISGHFALDFSGILTNDEKSTSVKVNLSDFELSVYSIQIPQNEIHLYVKGSDTGKNEIILDENVSGEETIVLYCSYHKNGQIVEFEKEVDVLFTAVATDDNEKIICTPKTPKVTFIDNRYDVRKNISNFLSNEKIVDEVLVGKSGGVSISGEKKSANLTSHGIKDEEFHGLLKVINPRLYGVTLNVDEITINGVLNNEIGENAMKFDTTNSPSGVPLKTTSVEMTIDDVDEFGRQHEIAKPVDVKIKMSKNDFYRTESFKFYRDENEDDGNPMKKDIFEVKIIPNDDDKGNENENEKPFVPTINDVYGEFSFNANDETKIQITDRTNYSEYAGLQKGTNEVTTGNYYKLSTDFGIKDLHESSKISIYGGYLSLSAQLSNES